MANSGRVRVQKFGRFMSGMVMPNLGAFIAWGLITALFISTGWIPNERFAKLVGPMLTYLLPLLIGFTGGKIVHGIRGGVVGAVATMGVIVGADVTMLMGAMIMGPVGGLCVKKFDKLTEGKIAGGFEMLVENFSAGIIGLLLALISNILIQPIMTAILAFLTIGVNWIVYHKMLPFSAVFIEPAKVLFLNNAVNHGVLAPIAVEQVKETGKSVLFLLESNPGPGLGVLLAYWMFSKGTAKASAPGAIIVHFLGGIHEIYFPYILMQPILLLATIAGGFVGQLTFVITGAGEVATPSPGSIFALIAVAPKGGLFPVLLGVLTSAIVSFVVAMPFVKKNAAKMELEDGDDMLEMAKKSVQNMKDIGKTENIYFACDAGMGTSAMGASKLKKMLKEAGKTEIKVEHVAIDAIPPTAQLVICQKSLVDRAKQTSPNAQVFGINNLVNSKEYKEIVETITNANK
ncbi:MAG: PTS mannitol transporter subunit IIBC [Treponema sp. CETP13]|nr:MAG: PTS mannitol transporter subunit IIBC [Treponema sp. CETP13]